MDAIGGIAGVMNPSEEPPIPTTRRDPFAAILEMPKLYETSGSTDGVEQDAKTDNLDRSPDTWTEQPPMPEWLEKLPTIREPYHVYKPVNISDWISWEVQRKTFDILDWFNIYLGLNVEEFLSHVESTGIGRAHVTQQVALCGTDSFGAYLPWHTYAKSRKTPWGMYFFLEPLGVWAVELAAEAKAHGLNLSNIDALRLAFYLTYRHELFHYHVERFAIRQEVIQRKPIYRPYEENVFNNQQVANTEDWLEEALAQAVVLESTLVANRLKVKMAAYRKILESEFDKFGAGYKDYHCKKFGGTEKAHMRLGAQVVSGQQFPGFMLTEKFTPKKEYVSKVDEVPGYIVARRPFISRFQLGMPKRKKWERFANSHGISFVKYGKGDHERWRVNDKLVAINRHNGEVDRKSLNAVAHILGVPLHKLVEDIRQA